MDKKRKFNIIDVMIILFVFIIIAGVAFSIRHLLGNNSGETKTVILEVTECKQNFCDILKKDELAYDGVENVELGTIVDFEVKPTEMNSISSIDGTIKKAIIPERYDVLLTIEIPMNTDVRVGKQLWLETALYKCNGYIIDVNDGGKAAEKHENN